MFITTSRTPSTPIKLLDRSYVQAFSPVRNYIQISSNSRLPIDSGDNLLVDDITIPVTINGTNKSYIGRMTSLDIQGSPTNPTIMGLYTRIFSNSTFPAGTGVVYGNYASVDIGGVFSEAYGGYFGVLSGGDGASGIARLVAIQGVCNIAHNGNTTEAISGDFWVNSSLSSPSVVTKAYGLKARLNLNVGLTIQDLRFMSIGHAIINGGTVEKSYGIKIDSTIDLGTVEKWAIHSLSTSPSLLSGSLQMAEITAPAAPAANTGVVYFDDNGSGKTRMMVRFPTGAAIQLAIQP
jgi:hypothetical protein